MIEALLLHPARVRATRLLVCLVGGLWTAFESVLRLLKRLRESDRRERQVLVLRMLEQLLLPPTSADLEQRGVLDGVGLAPDARSLRVHAHQDALIVAASLARVARARAHLKVVNF